jgi:uncharacterized protein (TIGR03083 family)
VERALTAVNTATAITNQLSEVWTSLAGLGAELDDQQWLLPTACPGWNVAAQYAHVIGTESMLLGRPNPVVEPGRPLHVHNDIAAFNEVWVAAFCRQSRQAVLAQLDEVTAARGRALTAMTEDDFSAPSWTPVGDADYRRFMQIRVFDCWVHEQDVRDAVGLAGHLEGPAVDQSLDEIVRALGYIVGKKAAAPDHAAVTIELTGPVRREINVAVEGRARVVDTLDRQATATLSMGSTTFARLACGRLDPAAVLAKKGEPGGVRLDGDTELGLRIILGLPFTI